MKILRRPMLAAALAAAVDVFMLAAAVVLDLLRDKFSASYSFDLDSISIATSHPYDMFGIFSAAALVFAAVMAAFIIAGGVTLSREKAVGRIVGGVVLIVASAAVILLAFLVVRGKQPEKVGYYTYTDDTLRIVVVEEQYDENLGAAKFFCVSEDSTEAKLLVSTDISTFANGDKERYTLEWRSDNVLGIKFMDGSKLKVLQVNPYI